MKVAVVIPLHNHASYIGAAVASLRAQSRPPDRIIVIDDGSTDGSVNALMAAGEEGLPTPGTGGGTARGDAAERVETRTDVVIQANAGAPVTLNRAIALADDCDYVAILNSDDCYHPRRLERCLSYLEEHQEIDLVCTRLRLIDPEGETLSPDHPRTRWFSAVWGYSAGVEGGKSPDLAEWLGLANFAGPTSNFFARGRYLRKHPFKEYPVGHGYYALITAALENKLGILNAELLDFRVHPTLEGAELAEPVVREMLRMNLDLARSLAPLTAANQELRASFKRYQRALWSNVSAVRADLLNVLLCEALATLPMESNSSLVDGLLREQYPEIGEVPNRAILSFPGGTDSAFGPTSGLADKFYQLKAQLSAARTDVRPWMEYRQLQTALLDSRWYALGRLLGRASAIARSGGKTPHEKITELRERIASSRWLRLGSRLGVGSARRVLALSRSSAQVD